MKKEDINDQPIPEHLKRWPGLYVRQKGEIIEASEEDVELAKQYPIWKDKGAFKSDRRVTILCQKEEYTIDEAIRVIHVLESLNKADQVYIMGPKQVYGEYVDEKLVTEAASGEYPWIPGSYRGKTLLAPAVDYNYEMTTYTFSEAGEHSIQWRLGDLLSNTLRIKITSK